MNRLRCQCGNAETVSADDMVFIPIGPHYKKDDSMCPIQGPIGRIVVDIPGLYILSIDSLYRITRGE